MYLSSGRYPLRIRGDTLGEPVTFGLPRREKKLTLAYRCGEREGVIAENTTREEILWTPPLELAEAFPEKSVLPIAWILTAPDGSRREERWELKLPADILPELQLEAEDVTGLGVFVQGPGRLRLRAQAQGRYGAGIRRILLSCGGSPGEGESRIFDLPEPGEVTVSARVWDSRGRSVRRETTLSVLPWEPPKGGLGQIQEKNGLYLAQWWGKVSDVAGKNQGTFTLVVPKGEKELRFPLGEGRELAGQTGVTQESAGDRLILEAADRLTRVRIPCLLEPFLDICPGDRALGIGCRGDRTGALSLGLPVSMGGNPLEDLAQAQADTDALPLGQGDRRYLRPRLLWENQTPTADFPAGRVPAEGKLFLIEAAPKADSGDTFWELGFPGGCLRAGDGAERTFAYEEGALRFGTTEKGDGWAVPRKIYALL